jgi:hypothetical protein
MKVYPVTATALTLAAAGFIVAGCSTSSSSPAATSATTQVTSSAAASSTAQAGSATAAPSASQPAQAAGSATCQTGSLGYALGAATGTSSQRTQIVDLTNKGSSACTLEGFPGVNLTGTANGQANYSWSLVRQSARYSAVTLQPGGTAHFGLVYLPGTSASTDIAVSTLVMTPPNDYSHTELTWNQSVVLQDAATRPGTYVTPVVAGS